MKSTKQIKVVYCLLLFTLAGCSPEMPDMTTPPPIVSILEVKPSRVELKDELTGRVAPVRVAEIRPQVSGIIQERLFVQGAEVLAGQPLFQINPAPFKADVETSAAALMRAEAALNRAKIQVQRLQPLVESDAVSRQTYDDAVSTKEQATADVAQAKAELSRRKLDLQFSTVDSPINGRIDQSIVSEGSLVSPNDNTSLAKVQQISEVYVDVRQPAESLDLLREATKAGKKELHVEILKASGKSFDVDGKVLFSGLTVDETTGDILVRILVNNKQRTLLPGMFVRARLTLASFDDALLVPQEAVTRTGEDAWVWLLSEDNKVRQVHVQLGELIDRGYRIEKGIKAGDKVIVSGLDRMSEGAEVTPSNLVQPTVGAAYSRNTSTGGRE
ncbi:efflux RND transporter periplasmic adaptor subunit [Vibrio fluvialis]|uniref:efflux RND transporter periplasmic adaptor subunit n=1 Tax=Vibrio fluvialis TaxID=676 RepID=UPI001EEB9C2F|nr:efflux RND transporter periplasmic adaptor subunit [Vibrio fluvialis]MCG6403265.1 efflux RND transporter periplasmic adaptor subunit [Vibrio fluvialis]